MSQDELTPNTAPLVAHALGAERAGAIDVGAACTGLLSGLQLAAGQIESGRAERVLLIGAEILTPPDRPRRPQDRRAVRRRRRRGRARAGGRRRRSGRSRWPPTARSPRRSSPRTRTARSAWTATRRSRTRSSALAEATVAAMARAGLELDDIDLFVYHQANGRILRARRRAPRPAAGQGRRLHRRARQHVGRVDPARARPAREDGRLRPGAPRARRRVRRRLHVGRRRRGVGDRVSRPRGRRRARDRRLARHRRGDRQGAGRRRLGRRGQLPRRRGRAPSAPSTRSRRPAGAPSPSRATSPTAPATTSSSRPRPSSARCSRSSTTPASRADGLAIQLDDDAWDKRHRHEPHRRLPPHPPRAALDDPGALRPHHQHRLASSARAPTPARPTTRPPRPA